MMLFKVYNGTKDGFDIQRIIASCYEELSGLLTARNSIYIDHSKDDFLDVLLPEFKKTSDLSKEI